MLFTVGGVNRVRNELDPHIVTGILQKTLKELSPSPFHDVYENILATEINEDSVQERQTVQNWLVKLPQDRFELVSTIKIVVGLVSLPSRPLRSSIICLNYTHIGRSTVLLAALNPSAITFSVLL